LYQKTGPGKRGKRGSGMACGLPVADAKKGKKQASPVVKGGKRQRSGSVKSESSDVKGKGKRQSSGSVESCDGQQTRRKSRRVSKKEEMKEEESSEDEVKERKAGELGFERVPDFLCDFAAGI
jgi:hypothetical protein